MYIVPLVFILSLFTPKTDTFEQRFHFKSQQPSATDFSSRKRYRVYRYQSRYVYSRKRSYSNAYRFKRRPVGVASQNIFKRYQAASSSRSCLTGQTASILSALEARVGRVSIVSTCRKGAVIAGTRRPSYHRYGMAVDFSTSNKATAIAFLKTQPVLVMTYSNMGHIHFNTGQKGAIYGANAYGGGRRYAKRNYYTASKRKWRYRRR